MAPAIPKASRHASDRRAGTLRRNVNDLFMRDGQVEESKLWANIGKGIACYLMVAYTKEVMETEYTLTTLLVFVVAPDLLKKFMSMRLGGMVDKGGK